MVAGTEKSNDELVCPLEKKKKIYNSITKAPIKVMARRIGAKHGEMLYSADGYVTAWFMWQLQGDEEDSKAFVGNDAELLKNKLYQNQNILEWKLKISKGIIYYTDIIK